jgi:hypothetical protein
MISKVEKYINTLGMAIYNVYSCSQGLQPFNLTFLLVILKIHVKIGKERVNSY